MIIRLDAWLPRFRGRGYCLSTGPRLWLDDPSSNICDWRIFDCVSAYPLLRFCPFLLCFNTASSWSGGRLERSLEQGLQCQDTMALYRQALKMTLNSLSTDRERHIMKEASY